MICFCILIHAHAQPVVYLVAGQSNAQGMGDAALSTKASTNAWQYSFAKDSLLPLADPCGFDELSFKPSASGSAWPSFAAEYSGKSGRSILIVQAARGGSSCTKASELGSYGTWAESGQLFSNSILKTKAALKKTSGSLAGIIWLQGERDANAINDKKQTVNQYKAGLKNLIERFQLELGDIPFYIVLTGYYRDHPKEGFDAVRKVQEEVAKEMRNVFVVYKNTHRFLTKKLLQEKDGIHYTQPALNELGTAIARRIITIEKRKIEE
jgi:hypothetical protein